jgi:phosphoglycolate phosphatase
VRRHDGIIFDLDGTLWDGAETAAKGWGLALQSCGVRGVEVSADDIRSVAGQPFEVCVRTLFPGLPDSSGAEFLHALDAGERALFEAHGGRIFPGVAEGMELLSADHDLFIVSNCQQWYLECFWMQYSLRRHFASWDCHGASGAPKSEMIERIVDRYGVMNPIYIGDTEGDRQAADAAGVDFGYASFGFGRVAAPAPAFASFGELVAWFGRPDVRDAAS